MPPDLQILIIGGGLSGLSAALHLARAGVEDLFVLEAERIGQGGNVDLPGTPGPVFPDYTKMVLTPDDRGYTYLSRRFNREVARNLLRVKRRGVELQLALARESLGEPWLFPHDLQRDLLIELTIGAIGQIDDGHATDAENRPTAIGANEFPLRSDRVLSFVSEQLCDQVRDQRAPGPEPCDVDRHSAPAAP